MSKNIAVGLDIGTYHVKVVIAEAAATSYGMPNVLGVGFAESKGLRHGYIINQADAIKSIRKAIRQAERTAGYKVKKVFISVGGIGLSSHTSTGSIMISRADNEITELDVEKVLEEAQRSIPQTISINKRIIHNIPVQFSIDGKQVLGSNPVGMKGVKLEATVLFVFSLEHHLSELVQAVEDSGIGIADVMAAPISASCTVRLVTKWHASCCGIRGAACRRLRHCLPIPMKPPSVGPFRNGRACRLPNGASRAIVISEAEGRPAGFRSERSFRWPLPRIVDRPQLAGGRNRGERIEWPVLSGLQPLDPETEFRNTSGSLFVRMLLANDSF